MQNSLKALSLLLISLTLANCSYVTNSSYVQNRSKDYLKAESIPPLRIPPGLSSSTIHGDYPVSDQVYPAGSKEVSLVPPGL
jgi:uncharacterized lipoprotein